MQQDITDKISQRFEGAEVHVQLEGNKGLIRVISPEFAGMSRVQKQQAVYACIAEEIADGRLHAVTIQALVPEDSAS